MDALPANRTWQPSRSHGTYQHEAITSRSRQLLMMGTWLPETCWATVRREIKIQKVTSSWFFLSTPYICQILTQLVKARVGARAIRSTNLLVLCGMRTNSLWRGMIRSLCLSIRKAIKQIVVFIGGYNFRQLRTKCYPEPCCQGEIQIRRK